MFAFHIIDMLNSRPAFVTEIAAFYQAVKSDIDPDSQVSIEQQIANIAPPA